MKKSKPSKSKVKPESNQDLKQIDIHINEFGQIVRSVGLDKINAFLDKNVPDKKLDTEQ